MRLFKCGRGRCASASDLSILEKWPSLALDDASDPTTVRVINRRNQNNAGRRVDRSSVTPTNRDLPLPLSLAWPWMRPRLQSRFIAGSSLSDVNSVSVYWMTANCRTGQRRRRFRGVESSDSIGLSGEQITELKYVVLC